MSHLTDAEALMRKGDWEGAFALCSRLVDEHPIDPTYQAYLGICHAHFGRVEQAADALRRAVALNPRYWQANMKLAQCLDRLGRYEEALEAARGALQEKPSDASLIALVRGLERHVPDRITDAYQLSMLPGYWLIEMREHDEEEGSEEPPSMEPSEDGPKAGRPSRRPCADSP